MSHLVLEMLSKSPSVKAPDAHLQLLQTNRMAVQGLNAYYDKLVLENAKLAVPASSKRPAPAGGAAGDSDDCVITGESKVDEPQSKRLKAKTEVEVKLEKKVEKATEPKPKDEQLEYNAEYAAWKKTAADPFNPPINMVRTYDAAETEKSMNQFFGMLEQMDSNTKGNIVLRLAAILGIDKWEAAFFYAKHCTTLMCRRLRYLVARVCQKATLEMLKHDPPLKQITETEMKMLQSGLMNLPAMWYLYQELLRVLKTRGAASGGAKPSSGAGPSGPG